MCVQVYDPAEDSWTAIASMMVPRCEFGLCAVDGRLYAFGGWVGEDIGEPSSKRKMGERIQITGSFQKVFVNSTFIQVFCEDSMKSKRL